MTMIANRLSLIVMVFSALTIMTGAGHTATAQQPPVCEAKYAGAMTCQAGVRCKCAFFRGGLMIAEPEGYRWDCGPLNGSCYTEVPATTSRHEGGGGRQPWQSSVPPGTVVVPAPPFPQR
ncbi:exported hypothetical protein [uncultured Gammaproteobacteria bacterium]